MFVTMLSVAVQVFLVWGSFSVAKETNPLIIVSTDGMFWKTLEKNLSDTPNYDYIAETGVNASPMRSVTPTKTWPNHVTLLTGLYPESHGIVSNRFWDPVYKERYFYDYHCSNYDPKFYNASEPIWLTHQKRGGRSGVYFWPGYAGYEERPTYYEKENCEPGVNCSDPVTLINKTTHCIVNYSEPFQSRIDKVMGWLKSDKPPQFVALYIDEPDWKGHDFGTNSSEYLNMTSQVDRTVIGHLIKRLRESEMLDSVNLIFVSDHGFVNFANPEEREILLNEYIDPNSYMVTELGASAHIWPKEGKLNEIYNNLTREKNPRFTVYKKENIPDSFHWKHNRRIPPLLVQPNIDWLVFNEFEANYSHGVHGYPAHYKDMWSIFYARGPAFRKGLVLDETIEAVDVYPLMCYLLGIEPLPNNGSFDRVKKMLTEFAKGGQERATMNFTLNVVISVSLLYVLIYVF